MSSRRALRRYATASALALVYLASMSGWRPQARGVGRAQAVDLVECATDHETIVVEDAHPYCQRGRHFICPECGGDLGDSTTARCANPYCSASR